MYRRGKERQCRYIPHQEDQGSTAHSPYSLIMKKIPWSRASEACLLDLVRKKRFLWYPKDSLYHKNKHRQEAFREIAETLRSKFPELIMLSGDQARMKFKNLRTYLILLGRKFRDAPNGSERNSVVKWPLYDSAAFLLDAADIKPSKSPTELPSTAGVDSDDSLGSTLSIGAEYMEDDGPSLEKRLPTPEDWTPVSHNSEDAPQTSVFTICKEEPGSSKNGITLSSSPSKRKRVAKKPDPVNTLLNILGEYVSKNKNSAENENDFASNMGKIVQSAAASLPLPTQIKLLRRVLDVIEEVMTENNGGSG